MITELRNNFCSFAWAYMYINQVDRGQKKLFFSWLRIQAKSLIWYFFTAATGPVFTIYQFQEPVKKYRILISNPWPAVSFLTCVCSPRRGVAVLNKSLYSSLPDFPLSPDVPDVELEALSLHRFDVEALGRRYRRNIFTEIRSFTYQGRCSKYV